MNPIKTANTRHGLRTPSLVVGIGFVLVLSAVFLLPDTNADFSMDVNNVHCAHERLSGTTDQQAVFSGVPYHDHTGIDTSVGGGEEKHVNFRTHCGNIVSSLVSTYSVAPDPVAHLRAELYLGSDNPNNQAEGAVCLEAYSIDQEWETNGWECGDIEDSGSENAASPAWFPNNLHLPLPSTFLPELVKFKVGFMDRDESVAEETTNYRNVYHYNGPDVQLADIQDSAGGNEYNVTDEFRSWNIHDPEGDDKLVIGGVPVTLSPGSKFDFPDFDIEVAYEERGGGSGNEWRVRHTGEENRVFVWDHPEGDWEIRYLDW